MKGQTLKSRVIEHKCWKCDIKEAAGRTSSPMAKDRLMYKFLEEAYVARQADNKKFKPVTGCKN